MQGFALQTYFRVGLTPISYQGAADAWTPPKVACASSQFCSSFRTVEGSTRPCQTGVRNTRVIASRMRAFVHWGFHPIAATLWAQLRTNHGGVVRMHRSNARSSSKVTETRMERRETMKRIRYLLFTWLIALSPLAAMAQQRGTITG